MLLVADEIHQLALRLGGTVTGEHGVGAVRAAYMPAEHGPALETMRRIKRALESVDDAFFNALARTVNAIPAERRTLGRIFAHALVQHPQLIPVAARFFI